MTPEGKTLLRAEKVSKHFGGLAALSEVSFSIGAVKSTA
jgi:ABC-type branched-subunit amino acid transport system ATPase component